MLAKTLRSNTVKNATDNNKGKIIGKNFNQSISNKNKTLKIVILTKRRNKNFINYNFEKLKFKDFNEHKDITFELRVKTSVE